VDVRREEHQVGNIKRRDKTVEDVYKGEKGVGSQEGMIR